MVGTMAMPVFRFHPDPVATGSVVASDDTCLCCRRARGFVYDGPVYTESEPSGPLCPWCIADGTAHAQLDVTFVDDEAFEGVLPETTAAEITQRTPGFATWQSEVWPTCCGDATVFRGPAGIREIRATARDLEGQIMSHIVYEMGISGAAATRLLDSLDRDRGPTLYHFECGACGMHLFRIDSP